MLLLVCGGSIRIHIWNTCVMCAAVGAEADDDRIELLLSQVEGKDITELIAAGREKLASVPCGGGGGGVAVAAPAGGAAAAASAAEEKKEEKKEEKEESDDVRCSVNLGALASFCTGQCLLLNILYIC